jgi:UPF0271 protein
MAGAVPARTKSAFSIFFVKLDLNCDLGEGESLARTRALMRWITSANVACGGHAGDVKSMQTCVRLAKQHCVRLGAHPGPWSRGDFGRQRIRLTPDELEMLLLQQVGALERISRAHAVRLHHIKLHGALYHASETSADLGRRYIETVVRWWPAAVIYARAGGGVVRLARRAGLRVWEEAFADRGYRNDGTLVPRGEPGALLTEVRAVAERVRLLIKGGKVQTVTGKRLPLRAQTICLHSDTPQAVGLAQAVAKLLTGDDSPRRERCRLVKQ